MTSLAPAPIKPRLRGWLHAGAFPIAVACGIVLVVLADSMRARVSTAVYGLTAALLFGVSALYHRGRWSPRVRIALQRLDHSNIFLMIAGTYTPFGVLLFRDHNGGLLLWIVWSAALAGVALRVLWVRVPGWLFIPLYLALGWTAVFWLPAALRTGALTVLVLLVIGGALYTIGAIVMALGKPDPSPHWFGYHEVFHALTLVAWLLHYVAVSITAYTVA